MGKGYCQSPRAGAADWQELQLLTVPSLDPPPLSVSNHAKQSDVVEKEALNSDVKPRTRNISGFISRKQTNKKQRWLNWRNSTPDRFSGPEMKGPIPVYVLGMGTWGPVFCFWSGDHFLPLKSLCVDLFLFINYWLVFIKYEFCWCLYFIHIYIYWMRSKQTTQLICIWQGVTAKGW